ncbi:hypothetical protein V0R52_08940 [Pseudomonas asiatica]|uniref:hypothetical protein n=1 Tax=Pseudomonas asiatica TaxID=2219225 RepID=UPI002E7B00F2|nr:hypothetical protein [Pseudomonas asiatica]MEE1916517.1 hypothetical protein [Pseudomonas asiatica]
MGVTIKDLSKEYTFTSSVGDLKVRRISLKDLLEYEREKMQLSDRDLGESIIKTLVSMSRSDGLPVADIYKSLSSSDLESLISIISRYLGCSDKESTTLESLGGAVRKHIKSLRARNVEFPKGFTAAIGADLASSISQSRFDLADSSSHLLELAHAEAKPIGQILEPLIKSEQEAYRRINKNAAEVSDFANSRFESLSRALAEMGANVGELNRAVLTEALPKYLDSLESSRRSESKSLKIAVGGIVISAIVSLGVAVWQGWGATMSGALAEKQYRETSDNLASQLAESRRGTEILTKMLEESRAANVYAAEMLRQQNKQMQLILKKVEANEARAGH